MITESHEYVCVDLGGLEKEAPTLPTSRYVKGYSIGIVDEPLSKPSAMCSIWFQTLRFERFLIKNLGNPPRGNKHTKSLTGYDYFRRNPETDKRGHSDSYRKPKWTTNFRYLLTW